jgi:hypothetical protein
VRGLQRSARREQLRDLLGVEWFELSQPRRRNYDVEGRRMIVDDAEAEPGRIQLRSDGEVGIGWRYVAARMVVDDQATRLCVPRRREHRAQMAARHHPRGRDPTVVIDASDEADLVAVHPRDLRAEPHCGARLEPELRRHVFNVFFFAAGKRTLFRISR